MHLYTGVIATSWPNLFGFLTAAAQHRGTDLDIALLDYVWQLPLGHLATLERHAATLTGPQRLAIAKGDPAAPRDVLSRFLDECLNNTKE